VSAGSRETRIEEKHISGPRYGRDKVAILSIEGTILDGEGFFRRQIDRAREEHKSGTLKAIVLRVNSPGGTVSGSDFMYHHLKKLREETGMPVVVSMGAVAASGGYYVSMAVGDTPEAIFAEPTTWTGSIGVMIPHYDLSAMLGKIGVAEDAVTSHRLKGMGSLARPMTEEERKIFQGLVDEGFEQFKKVIQSGRPGFRKDPTALDKLATGQVFTADQAKQSGLVDQIGFVEDAVDRAITLAGLSAAKVHVVKYKPEFSFSEIFFGSSARAHPLDLGILPRAGDAVLEREHLPDRVLEKSLREERTDADDRVQQRDRRRGRDAVADHRDDAHREILRLACNVGLAGDHHRRGGPDHGEVLGACQPLRDRSRAVDRVEGEALAEDVVEVERDAARQRLER